MVYLEVLDVLPTKHARWNEVYRILAFAAAYNDLRTMAEYMEEAWL